MYSTPIVGGAHFVRCKNIVWLIHGHPKVKHKQRSGHDDSDDDCTGDSDAMMLSKVGEVDITNVKNTIIDGVRIWTS